jgi:hypothetical protein
LTQLYRRKDGETLGTSEITRLRARHLLAVCTRGSQLRKRFPKLRGRATDDSLKLATEVGHGLESACEGSFANSRVGIEQKRLRFLHSHSREVVDEVHTGRLPEHFAKVMPADISQFGNDAGLRWRRSSTSDRIDAAGKSLKRWRLSLFSLKGVRQSTMPAIVQVFALARFEFWIQPAMSSGLFRSTKWIDGCKVTR